MGKLIVKDEILIHASAKSVWQVLVDPTYVAVWDELPEDYPNEPMGKGSEVIWDLPNGEQSITRLTKVLPEKELMIDLINTIWPTQPKEGEVGYHYTLTEEDEKTLLTIKIGDFSLIQNGQDYYDASIEFAEESKRIIKKLAEDLEK
jgi:uncharacterized protein YndB with AHSA1/START domain